MTQRTFAATAGTVFSIIAVLHAIRIIFRWEAVISGWLVPHWISWVAVFLFGGLAYAAFKQK